MLPDIVRENKVRYFGSPRVNQRGEAVNLLEEQRFQAVDPSKNGRIRRPEKDALQLPIASERRISRHEEPVTGGSLGMI